jgi:negative regulator of flagellin synthesis FlgM
MNINIEGLPGGLVQNAGDSTQTAQVQSPPQAQQPANPAASAPTAGQDTLSLTDSATRLRNLESTINSLPAADSQRVESVQRQLATGSFSVDPVSTANKMLEMERTLP